jgi:hypothetical protein
MSSPRFKHVYTFLLGAAFLCAFVVPSSYTDPARLHIAGIFNPLSGPVRRLAAAIEQPLHRAPADDPRTKDAIVRENDQLRQEIARLQITVDRLQGLESERQELGDLQSMCVHVGVAGNDSGGRDGLLLSASGADQLDQDAPVLYSSGGLAGKLDARLGGARVRLITDEGFAETGAFIRFVDADGAVTPTRVPAPTPLVRGLGHGQIGIFGMKITDYVQAGLRVGDWVVLEDAAWPHAVQGRLLGKIVSCGESRQAPLFADIRLQPETDLSRLSDVWVLTR